MKMVENYDSKSSNMNSKEYYFLNNCDQQSEFSQNYMNELVNEHERTHFNLINMSGWLLSDEIIGWPSNKILLSDKINELKINNFDYQNINFNDNENWVESK